MRLILEKDEILQILARHFDVALDSTRVIIRTDPTFEIEVAGIPLGTPDAASGLPSAATMESPPRTRRADADSSQEPPEEEPSAASDVDVDLSPAAILARSKQLEIDLEATDERANKRRAGAYSLDPPKSSFKEEL